MMSTGEPNGFNGVYRAIGVARDGERTRPACEGLRDLADPHAGSRRREPPLLVPDRGFGSRVCPRNRVPHRPPRPGFVLSLRDRTDAAVEPYGVVAEPLVRCDARRP